MTIQNSVSMHLRRAYLAMHRRAQACFSQSGITADQYVILSVLAEEAGITQRELGEKICSDANTVTAMLRLLETKELIKRQPHDVDRRARSVCLTPKGKRLHKKLVNLSESLHQQMESVLSETNREEFIQCLTNIEQLFEAPVLSK